MEMLIRELIVLIITIPVAIVIYKLMTNKKTDNNEPEMINLNTGERKTINESEGVIYDKNEPLDKNIFIQQMTYADQKQDSRTDEILNTLDAILFWIRIIGLYFLAKIIISLLTFIIAGQTIKELLSNIL